MPKPQPTASGRWKVRVRHPDPAPGRSGYTSATFPTEAEAWRFCRDVDDRGVAWALAEYKRASGNGTPTLDEWAKRHFASMTEASAYTIATYKRIYEKDWSPQLGHLPLASITRMDVATALNTIAGSDKTRKNKWGVLTLMLKLAVTDGVIPRSPHLGVKLGRHSDHERIEARFLTLAEFASLLDATPAHWKPMVMFLAGTGARWAEANALTVGDVDLIAGTVSITKAEKRDPSAPGKVRIGPTKTRKSRRTIGLPSELVTVLEDVIGKRKKSERLFLDEDGNPPRHHTFFRKVWCDKACADSGLTDPRPRIHDLRHSHAAWLIAEGVPLPVIQARLGHEKIATTVDTYGHLVPDLQQAAADATARVFAAMPKAVGPKAISA